MSVRASRRLVAAAALALLPAVAACDPGGTPSAPEVNGLVPGSYQVSIELYQSIGTPENVLGRHRITFRVAAPGTSVEHFSVTRSERIPPSGPVETGYMKMDSSTDVTEQQWIVRMQSIDESYQVVFTMKNAGYGDFQVTSGCFVRTPAGATFQGSGCVVDRV